MQPLIDYTYILYEILPFVNHTNAKFFCIFKKIPAFGDFLRADRRAARSPHPRFWGYSSRRNAAGLYLQHPSSPSALIASWRSGRCGRASFVYPLARACPRVTINTSRRQAASAFLPFLAEDGRGAPSYIYRNLIQIL